MEETTQRAKKSEQTQTTPRSFRLSDETFLAIQKECAKGKTQELVLAELLETNRKYAERFQHNVDLPVMKDIDEFIRNLHATIENTIQMQQNDFDARRTKILADLSAETLAKESAELKLKEAEARFDEAKKQYEEKIGYMNDKLNSAKEELASITSAFQMQSDNLKNTERALSSCREAMSILEASHRKTMDNLQFKTSELDAKSNEVESMKERERRLLDELDQVKKQLTNAKEINEVLSKTNESYKEELINYKKELKDNYDLLMETERKRIKAECDAEMASAMINFAKERTELVLSYEEKLKQLANK